MSSRALKDSFWVKVQRGSSDECWPWLGSLNRNGYGQFSGTTKTESAHRLAYNLTYGAIPLGLWVLHKCDNKVCCNPRHLYVGTIEDNTLDALRRGRFLRGERVWCAVLTEESVLKARRMYDKGETCYAIAKELGTGYNITWEAVTGKTWSHLPLPKRVQLLSNKGESHRGAVLTEEIVLQARILYAQGHKCAVIARQLCPGSEAALRKAIYGKTWKHLEGAVRG